MAGPDRARHLFIVLLFCNQPVYSFRIAASGLSLIARSDGKNPATIPTSTANMTAEKASHGGI